MARTSLYLISCGLAASLLLAACGDKQDATPAGTDTASAGSNAAADASPPTVGAPQPTLPQPDGNTPLAEYRKLDSGQQVMFLYAALSRLPPDFEQMAGFASQEFRSTSDAFRRKDLLTALQPQLQQSIADAARSPYYWSEQEDADLQPYDFQRKGFPVGAFSGDRFHYFHDLADYSYTLTNAAQVQLAPVADETLARELESLRSRWNTKPGLRVYFFAQSADLNRRRVNAVVTHVQLVDRTGRVLATYTPDASVALAAPAAEEDCGNDAVACAMRAAGG